ncbi:patatin-like phospholipase family protein [Actinotalea sp.]|uniref:patatin-like phospholipase family protein n=1 Tax=Actinotalea sp. TaxID=1872145 RepID=UPI00356AFB83
MSDLVDCLPRPVAFVLGGGASLGAVQVGMLEALEEIGLRPDLVVGTSVGALNGAVLAERPDGAVTRLRTVWGELERRDILPRNLLGLAWRLTQPTNSLLGTEGIEQVAEDMLRAETFEELEIPFVAVTLDLDTGGARILDGGPLVPALLASAAIPGVFPPVTVDGHLLVDGGPVATVPVREALDRGARSMVVLDCTVPGPRGTYRTVTDVLTRVAAIQLRNQLESALVTVAAAVPVVVLDAPPARWVSMVDFDQSMALMTDAHVAARSQLAALEVHGPGLYGEPFARYDGSRRVGPWRGRPSVGPLPALPIGPKRTRA